MRATTKAKMKREKRRRDFFFLNWGFSEVFLRSGLLFLQGQEAKLTESEEALSSSPCVMTVDALGKCICCGVERLCCASAALRASWILQREARVRILLPSRRRTGETLGKFIREERESGRVPVSPSSQVPSPVSILFVCALVWISSPGCARGCRPGQWEQEASVRSGRKGHTCSCLLLLSLTLAADCHFGFTWTQNKKCSVWSKLSLGCHLQFLVILKMAVSGFYSFLFISIIFLRRVSPAFSHPWATRSWLYPENLCCKISAVPLL